MSLVLLIFAKHHFIYDSFVYFRRAGNADSSSFCILIHTIHSPSSIFVIASFQNLIAKCFSFLSFPDPVAECTAYYYAPSGSQISLFPPIWQTAFILPNDTAAQAKWSSIAGSIPNIAPKVRFPTPTYLFEQPMCADKMVLLSSLFRI